MIDGIPNRPLYFYQKDIIVYMMVVSRSCLTIMSTLGGVLSFHSPALAERWTLREGDGERDVLMVFNQFNLC